MVDETEARSYDVEAVNSTEIAEQNCEDSRIWYTRDFLLSLFEADDCEELPAGVDQSIVRNSRISYTREHLLALAEEHVCKELPIGLDWSILSELEDVNESAPKSQILQGHESLSAGGTCEASSHRSLERWDASKLASADSVLTDSGRHNGDHFRRSLQIPVSMDILRSCSQNPEHYGILGSWSGSKPSTASSGSGLSDLKLQRTDSLLSKCSEPYRPPSFYKAMRHSETQNHDSRNDKTVGCVEAPSKQRAMEGSWRKASPELMASEPLQAIQEQEKPIQHDEKVSSNPGACAQLEEHSSVPESEIDRMAPTSPVVSASAKPRPTSGAAENLSEDSLELQPLLQVPEKTYHVSNLQPQILEGGRFCVLSNLEDAEDIDKDQTDEANLASDDRQIGHRREILGTMDSDNMQKKGTRSHVTSLANRKENRSSNIFQVNTVGKTAVQSSVVKSSVSSEISVKPSFVTSSTQEVSVSQKQKGSDIAHMGLQNGSTGVASGGRGHSAAEARLFDGVSEIWRSSRHTERGDGMDSRGSSNSPSEFAHWFSENDRICYNNSFWPNLGENNIWGAPTGMLLQENMLDKVKLRETSFLNQKLPESKVPDVKSSTLGHSTTEAVDFPTEGSKFNPTSSFGGEADTNFEINLPDEDSLITVDDTCIFVEEMPEPSPNTSYKERKDISSFSVSNKLMRSRSLHQNLSLPGPYFHKCQLNGPPQFQDPWSIYHYGIDPFPTAAVPGVHLPLMPQIFEPSLQHFLSLRAPQTHSCYPHFNNTISAEPQLYDQVYQVPCCQQDPDLPGSLPLNYQAKANTASIRGLPVQEGNRPKFSEILQTGKSQKNHQAAPRFEQRPYGLSRQEGNRPTFSQVLQLQMRMAQMNLNAVPGVEQNAYRKPMSNQIR